MKKIRFVIALMLLLSVLLLPACGSDNKTPSNSPATNSTDEVGGAGKDLADDAADMGEDVKDGAKDAADDAADMGEDMVDGVKDAADDVKDALTSDDKTNNDNNDVKDNTNTAKDTASTKQ